MTTRRTKHADQETTARPPRAQVADPVAAPTTRPKTAAEVVALQRAIGNEAVAAILGEDAVAQRATTHEVLGSTGRPLAVPVRADMEARLGADFSAVRVHTGPAAEQSATALGARAYTSGENVVLGAGGDDRHTLAHELTHVIQQRSGPVSGTDNGDGLSVSDPSDTFERAAEESAHRALDGPAPAVAEPRAGHVAGGRQHGQPVQLVRVKAIVADRPDFTDPMVKKIERWLPTIKLDVPVKLPAEAGAATRAQSRLGGNRRRDPRLAITGDSGMATITWAELIAGDPIQMTYDATRDVQVRPNTGPALGSAVDKLFDLMSEENVYRDKDRNAFTTALMDWLVRRRSSTSGKLTVATTMGDNDAGARVVISGRPGWDEQANQIVTGRTENRRHIIAWHTMRDAFQNIFNAALADGEGVTDKMSQLIEVLETTSTWASLDEAERSEAADEGGGGAVTDTQPSQSSSTADVPEFSQAATPVPESPAPSESDTGAKTAKELSTELTAVVTKVLNLLSNNPYNLWAGEGIPNKSINRVRGQLMSRLDTIDDDATLLTDVRERADIGARTPNEDKVVWTEVRNTLKDVVPADARKFIESIADSADIDVPVTGGDRKPSSTYRDQEDKSAAVHNILAGGLAKEVLAMAENRDLPTDFAELIAKMDSWLRRYLGPSTLRTTFSEGHRTVGKRPSREGLSAQPPAT
jgi:hypothetical protein